MLHDHTLGRVKLIGLDHVYMISASGSGIFKKELLKPSKLQLFQNYIELDSPVCVAFFSSV